MIVSKPRILRWSTADVAARDAADYWAGVTREAIFKTEISIPGQEGIEAELSLAALPPFGITWGTSNAQRLIHLRRGDAAQAGTEPIYLAYMRDASWALWQRGRELRMRPGDLALVSGGHAFEMHREARSYTVVMTLPHAWAVTWVPEMERLAPCAIRADSGWGEALAAFVRQLTPELALAPPHPAARIGDQLGGLLALALDAGAQEPSVADAGSMHELVLASLDERFHEPGLTARQVAEDLGVSERTLHRSFAGKSSSFAAALLARRMAAATRMLGDARFDRVAIAEIGWRAGFADPSHFVRQCRRHLGATPRALRKARRDEDGQTR